MYLNLLHCQVQKSVLIAHADQALGALAAHTGAQASIQLHHHQLVEALGDIVRKASGGDFIVRLNLEEEKQPEGWSNSRLIYSSILSYKGSIQQSIVSPFM